MPDQGNSGVVSAEGVVRAGAALRAERATVHDVDAIHRLVNFWAAKGEMLPRTLGETYENLRDFFVVRENGETVACGALHITWADLAELKSLAVREDRASAGYGSTIVRACIEEGRALGLERLFALTYRPGFFERLGFQQVDVMTLPRKVWNECYRCPKFPGCNEIAMVCELGEGDSAAGASTQLVGRTAP